MNHEESIKIMALIRTNYPAFHAKSDFETQQAAVNLLEQLLADLEYSLVYHALLKYMSGEHEYPPNAGQLRSICKYLQSPYVVREESGIIICDEEIPAIRDFAIQKYKNRHNKYFPLGESNEQNRLTDSAKER